MHVTAGIVWSLHGLTEQLMQVAHRAQHVQRIKFFVGVGAGEQHQRRIRERRVYSE